MRELSYLKLIFHLCNVLGRECVSHFSHVATDSKSNRASFELETKLNKPNYFLASFSASKKPRRYVFLCRAC